jgi:hypothetical protein
VSSPSWSETDAQGKVMAAEVIEKIRRIAGRLSVEWDFVTCDPAEDPIAAAGSANYLIGCAVRCFIVGRDADGLMLAQRADTWLTAAFDRATRGRLAGEVSIKADVCTDLVLSRWLAESQAALPDHTRCRAALQSYLRSLSPKKAREEWDWALPLLVANGGVRYCVRQFEGRYSRFRMAYIDRRGQAGMAYLLAKQQLEPVLSEVEMEAVTDTFLTRFVSFLLNAGQYNRCALWAKLLATPLAGERPYQTLRRVVLQHAV